MEQQVVVSAPARRSIRSLAPSLAGDERLARLVARGDEAAGRVLYERYHQQLYRYCRSLLRNEADAQDALQTTFISALGALGRGQRDAPLRPWLFRIAHNEAISLLRRRRPTQELSDVYEDGSVPLEEQVEERQRLTALVADLHELPERQRAALVLRELSGLSHEEIALAINSSVGATKQSIFEARRSLMEFAEGRAMICDEVRRLISDADGRVLRSRRVRAHMRSCPRCAAFAATIPERSRQLRALAPPLPVLASAGILARTLVAGSARGGDATGLAVVGGGKTIGAAIAIKATAAAVAVTAAVGATAALKHATPKTHGYHLAPAAGAAKSRRGGARPATGSARALPALAPGWRPSGGAGTTARSGEHVALGNVTVTGSPAAAPRGTSASSLSPSSTAPGRTGQTAGAGHASTRASNSRGLGPPAYPGQRSRSSSASSRSYSAHGAGSSRGSATATNTTRAQGARATTYRPQPPLTGATASRSAGSSGSRPMTAMTILPPPPKR